MIAKDVSGEHLFPSICLLALIVGVDCEEWVANFDLVTHFVMNNKTDGMIHRVGFFGAAGAQRNGSLANAAGIDLGQIAAAG